nr:MAG TPA: hypothetical protein [Caudoviricetes sp.]
MIRASIVFPFTVLCVLAVLKLFLSLKLRVNYFLSIDIFISN